MNGNPKEVLSAILGKGSKLTLGRLALLERAKSPVLELDIADLNRDIEAAFLYGAPLEWHNMPEIVQTLNNIFLDPEAVQRAKRNR